MMADDKYTFSVRWAVKKDIPSILKIEEETIGSWTEADFILAARRRKSALMVCTVRKQDDHVDDEVVCGFILFEIGKFETKVLNFANTWPEARRLLMDKAFQKAALHKTNLTWEEC
jgi:hypothetical protein